MMRALYSGVAGLKTHQTKMDVIGNNIANVNTIGFKSSSVTFSDIMYQTTSGASGATENTGGVNAKQIGLGVTTAATKVSITQAGASQSTGEAFDIKLTDSNNTNFFIVNNGTENLFTRAGSFYIDGNGNLAMTSTGYLVQGWQVDDATGTPEIKKDTVSPLRLMQASNLTSSPEATTDAYASGIIDKNDTNVTSDSGYAMSLTLYDNLGYSYTAKFAVKAYDKDAGTYTVKLSNIYDEDNNDILANYTGGSDALLANIFGAADSATKDTYSLSSGFEVSGGYITTTLNGVSYQLSTTAEPAAPETQGGVNGYTFTSTDGKQTHFFPLTDIYGVDSTTFPAGATVSVDDTTGGLAVEYTDTNYTLDFNEADGTFNYIGDAGKDAVSLNMSVLGNQFSNINVDFSKCLNYNNGGSSTLGMIRGSVDNASVGAGKKLGALTGLSVSSNGEIYGSYDNGNTVLLGQIAVAQFANASGLESLGNNCYATTLNSGDFDGIGVDITADGGKMLTGQLEMSNVDLSTEFTEMITTQRGFQANSRIITVSDTMLEELTNLKR